MRNDIELYINGQLVEFMETPDILWTYQSTDYTNPTAVKNGYTKTLTINGTPANNRIFNSISKLNRTQYLGGGDNYFNASQRTPFQLFRNGELIEDGYMKLDNIIKDGYKVVYQITLYGGLSQFFYNLTYSETGETNEKRSLSELTFLDGDDKGLSFSITKETVKDAWDNIGSGKWGVFNFAPCYDGLPEDFDADHIILNKKGLDCQLRFAFGDKINTDKFPETINGNYKGNGGFYYGELTKELTAWETRDLRSYLQRPVLSVKSLINAICNPINNGGYTVDLDTSFFTPTNPYWEKAWVTLPMLNDLEGGKSDVKPWRFSGTRPVSHKYGKVWNIENASDIVFSSSPDKYDMVLKLRADINGSTDPKRYFCTDVVDKESRLGGMCVQLYAVDDNGNVVAGSNVYFLTSKTQRGNMLNYQDVVNNGNYKPKWNASVITVTGAWTKAADGMYDWASDLNISIDLSSVSYSSLGLMINYVGNFTANPHRTGASTIYNALYTYPSTLAPSPFLTDEREMWVDDLESGEGKAYFSTTDGTHSGTEITKNDLLEGLDGTPCDWLLSYCKLFDLRLVKVRNEKRIRIMMRQSYYKDDFKDIEKDIDRSKTMNINPLTFSTKWYTLGYKGDERSEFGEKYYNKYGNDYGKQLIDTRYNFNVSTTDLLSSTVFNNGLECLEKSNYFTTYRDKDGKDVPSVFHNWVTIKYVNGDDEVEVPFCYPSDNTKTFFQSTYESYYDSFPKMQFHKASNEGIDGVGVLVFYNGRKAVGDTRYWLTDDFSTMFKMNENNPCWLVTESETNYKNERIAIAMDSLPSFGRYIGSDNSIVGSWDFGRTKELYVPDLVWEKAGTDTIYEKFWKKYIEDLYSVNARTVECYVRFGSTLTDDYMRRFYYWDNSYWILTKIEDFNASSLDTVKCTFTKVQDTKAYTDTTDFDDYYFDVHRYNGGGKAQADGDEYRREMIIYVSSNEDWTVSADHTGYGSFDTTNGYVVSGTGGAGHKLIRWVFNVNDSPVERDVLITVTRKDGVSARVRCWQKGKDVQTPTLTVTPNIITFSKLAGTFSERFSLKLKSSSAWTATLSGSWATLSALSGDKGETELTITATDNDGDNGRSLSIVFTNGESMKTTVSVTQNETVELSLTRQDSHWSIPQEGGTALYDVKSNVPWRLVSVGDWRTDEAIAAGQSPTLDADGNVVYDDKMYAHPNITSGTGNARIEVTYDPNNTTLTRTARFYISYGTGSKEERRYESNGDYGTQKAKNATASLPYPPTRGDYDGDGGEGITTWTATTGNDWITIKTPSGTGNKAVITYEVTQNDGAMRVGYITITYTDSNGYTRTEILEITQSGNPGVVGFTFNPTMIMGNAVDSKVYTITVTAPDAWTLDPIPDWITITQINSNIIGFKFKDNNTNADRTGTIVGKMGDKTASCTVIQKRNGNVPTLYINAEPLVLNFDDNGGTASISIKSNTSYTIEVVD